jgi:hypothetical protein
VREGWGHRLRPLTPALFRWEREKGTRVGIVSEKTYLCELPKGEGDKVRPFDPYFFLERRLREGRARLPRSSKGEVSA